MAKYGFYKMHAAMQRRLANEARKPYSHRVADAYEGERAKMRKHENDGYHNEKPAKQARREKLLKYWARARGH